MPRRRKTPLPDSNIDSKNATNGFLVAAGIVPPGRNQSETEKAPPSSTSALEPPLPTNSPPKVSSANTQKQEATVPPPPQDLSMPRGNGSNGQQNRPSWRQNASCVFQGTDRGRGGTRGRGETRGRGSARGRGSTRGGAHRARTPPPRSVALADYLDTSTITLPSIDLAAIRGPLNKNKNAPQLFYESPTPSLPSVSSLRGGGAGSSQCDADEGSPIAGRRDFRGTLGDDWHPIHYEGQFIRSWRSEFEDIKFPTVKFNTTDHHHRDINPSDGTFLPPVEYGDCFPSNEPASVEFPQGTEEYVIRRERRGREWRWRVWTAFLLMTRKVHIRHREQNLHNAWNRYPAWVPEADAPTESIQEKEEEEQQPQIISQPVPDYDLSAPRIPCYIRPAQISDMVQVVAIYNHEVENGLQAPDSKPLSLDDFKRIFTVETVSAGLPFLVAVYGSVKGFKTTTGKVHISPSTRRPPEATAWPNTSMVGRIAGFAYLSPWSLGLGGRPSEASRASVKVNLYVSPDFRRKRVGSALLDRLLSMHSTRFETRDNYDYIDAIKNPIYGSPEVNARKTWRMFLSYNVLHATGNQFSAEVRKATEENEKDLKSIEVVLEDSFYFDKIARYNMALRTPKKGAETVSWMDVVVYEHTCHNGGDFKDVVNY